jgi:tetraacyldisaccharide 4'-kinase
VIITKCPPDLSQEVATELKSNLALASYQSCYFTGYQYANPYSLYNSSHSINLTQQDKVIILSAIANTDYLRQYLDTFDFDVHAIEYEDHHYFTNADIEYIINRNEKVLDKQGIVLTTEKDAIRLAQYYDRLIAANVPVFVLPIHVQFLFDGKTAFDAEIKNRLLELEK